LIAGATGLLCFLVCAFLPAIEDILEDLPGLFLLFGVHIKLTPQAAFLKLDQAIQSFILERARPYRDPGLLQHTLQYHRGDIIFGLEQQHEVFFAHLESSRQLVPL
jgi:hypothetical protein